MKKKFDAVQFQRKVREELGKKYLSDPKAFARELRTKYAAEKGKHSREVIQK